MQMNKTAENFGMDRVSYVKDSIVDKVDNIMNQTMFNMPK